MNNCRYFSKISSPLWDAGDVNCGRSLPPSGRCLKIQVERVGEHLPAILKLQDRWQKVLKLKNKNKIQEISIVGKAAQLTTSVVPH